MPYSGGNRAEIKIGFYTTHNSENINLSVLLCEADHPTAEVVKEWVDSRSFKMSLATVYNTLNILVSAGLLREFKFSCLGKSVYDSNIIDHYHFFDEKSGKFYDIDPSLLSLSSKLLPEFLVNKTDILLTGNLVSET